jgi:mRNA interferase MazF
MCDFHGCIELEINKKRPVIVITVPFRSGLRPVGLTSTTEPKHLPPYQVRLSRNYHPNEPADMPHKAMAFRVHAAKPPITQPIARTMP